MEASEAPQPTKAATEETPPNPQPETGQKSPPESETEDQQDEDLSQVADKTDSDDDAEATNSLPKWVPKRLSKLKDQRDTERKRVKELEQRLQEAESKTAEPKPQTAEEPKSNEPLADLTDPKQIQAEVERVTSVANEIEKLLDEQLEDHDAVVAKLRLWKVNVGDEEENWSPKGVREFLKGLRDNARKTAEAGPKRLEFLQKESQSISAAIQLLPQLKDASSEETKIVMQLVREHPPLRQRPDWPVQAAIYAMGFQQYKKLNGDPRATSAPSESKSTTKPMPKVPAAPGAPKTAPAVETKGGLESARHNMRTNRTHSSLQEYARQAIAMTGD